MLKKNLSSLLAVTTLAALIGCQAKPLIGPNDPQAKPPQNTPSKLSTYPLIIGVVAGMNHTCVNIQISASKTKVKCWGSDKSGQIGVKPSDDPAQATQIQKAPIEVQGLPGPVQALAAGKYHTCALVTGRVFCWGRIYWDADAPGGGGLVKRSVPTVVSGLPVPVQAISAGGRHTCALSSGRVFCWGHNDEDQLGTFQNPAVKHSNGALEVKDLGDEVTSVVAGDSHTCVGKKDGGIKCWGNKEDDRLVDAGPADPVMNGVKAEILAAGTSHTCAGSSQGVVCWGRNDKNQLGSSDGPGSSKPVLVGEFAITGVKALSSKNNHSCALLAEGDMSCWGWNNKGQLGAGNNSSWEVPQSVKDLGGKAFSIAAGGLHSCALLEDKTILKCWGDNSSGQLGDGTRDDKAIPTAVQGLL